MVNSDEAKYQKIVGFLGTSDAYLKSTGAHTGPKTVRSVGTFGGSGGSYWDDGKHAGIKKIKLVYASAIDSIVVQYEDDGVSSWKARHGGNGGGTTQTITFDYPDEFLVSVSGYISILNRLHVIVSLRFETNKRAIGPYGPTDGTYFSVPSFGGKIVGFFGKSGIFLDSIGVHMVVPAETMQSVGTFGGPGGYYWDDGKHSGIKQIKIVYGSAIDSITTEYDDNGISNWSVMHGGHGGSSTATITLDQPNEFLVSISGYYSTLYRDLLVVSLTLESNKKTYGPYGSQDGTYFSIPSYRGKIVGFFGKSGVCLDSIGAHIVPVETIQSVSTIWGSGVTYWDDGKHSGIKQIKIGIASAIASIATEYVDSGVSLWSTKHGGNVETTITITLEHPVEFLTLVSGHHSTYNGVPILVSISFQTNKRTFGPYGPENGTYFAFPSFDGKIVGFFGRSRWYLDSLGAYVLPNEIIQSDGPFGGPGRNYWDDGVHNGIKQIKIAYASAVDALAIEYDDNGNSTWSAKHGGSGGLTQTLILDYPNEFIVFVSGHYSILNDVLIIVSLTFQSNRRTYGPYGPKKGTYFSFPSSGGKIVGFFGKSETYLDSIGAHVKPMSLPC